MNARRSVLAIIEILLDRVLCSAVASALAFLLSCKLACACSTPVDSGIEGLSKKRKR